MEFDNSSSMTYKGAKLRYYAIDYFNNFAASNLSSSNETNNSLDAIRKLSQF